MQSDTVDPEYVLEYTEAEAHVLARTLHRMFMLNFLKMSPKLRGKVLAQQYSLKKGLKLFGNRGSDAAKEELAQLHNRMTWHPLMVSSLSPSERRAAMESLMLLTEKRDG